jgi:SAM-dependent methyltransferase
MLMNALVALNLLQKENGTFSNTPLAARFLAEGSPDNARAALLHIANIWHSWSTLTDCVRAGTCVERSEGGTRTENSTQAFIAAMDRNAKERAPLVVRAVGNGFRHMLDLGGGSGAYSIAFAKANPELKAEVLDLPGVLPLTNEYIRKAGLEGQVITRSGDMRTDRFGQGYDLVLLSAIAHMFSPEQNRDLLQRAYQALVPKGKLVVQDFILEADKTAPKSAALFSLNMLVNTPSGASYSKPEYAAWLQEVGFTDVEHIRLPGPSGLMIGRKR